MGLTQPGIVQASGSQAGPPAEGTALEVRGLSKKYSQDIVALADVSLRINRGELFVVMGPSGCGKTSLLKCIAGMLEPDSGSVLIDGRDMKDIPMHKRDVSLIFQEFALFPHLNVFENIAFGLRLKKLSKAEIENEVSEILRLMDLSGMEKRFPRELSGGQKQRVAIARSLVVKPRILLFDEPLANLDYRMQRKMEEELKLLHQELGMTFVYVTHNQEQAMSLGDRIMVMNKGMIEQIGPPTEVYMKPRNIFTARFLGEVNLISGELVQVDDGAAAVKTGVGTFSGSFWSNFEQKNAKVAYGIRPENVSIIASHKNGFDNLANARFVNVIYRGTDAEYILELEKGIRFKAVVRGESVNQLKLKTSELVKIGWSTKDAFVLNEVSVAGGIDIESLIYGK